MTSQTTGIGVICNPALNNVASYFCSQISYQSIESTDLSLNSSVTRRTVSKLRNETYHSFSGLQPGTTYLVSVRARTAKGFGQTALTKITTNISGEAVTHALPVGAGSMLYFY